MSLVPNDSLSSYRTGPAVSIHSVPAANQYILNDEELIVLTDLFINYPVSSGYDISQLHCDRCGYNDPSLSYGEINVETVQDIFYRLAVHGFNKDFGGKLVDIGSGLGRILYASLLIHDFESCVGIEILSDLCDISKKTIKQWDKLKKVCSSRKQDCHVKFLCGDATVIEWSDADLVFIHPTCFDDILLKKMVDIAEQMVAGSFFVSVSKMITSDYFFLIDGFSGDVSWGKAMIYIYKRNETKLISLDRQSDRDFLISEGIIK
jgi:hypothetical protein